jgi:hypothetical protein
MRRKRKPCAAGAPIEPSPSLTQANAGITQAPELSASAARNAPNTVKRK